MHTLRTLGPRILIHIVVLTPLIMLVWDFARDGLGANPIEEITLRTGKTALILLVASLSCTPINTVFGVRAVLRLRRLLGLYAFFYVSIHFMTVVGLDYWFDFGLIWEDLALKRFILAGLAAFLFLLPLAVTSTRGWRKRLGRNWERLHWLVYLAALLAVTHFSLQVKVDLGEPLLYAGIVALLLIVRIPGVTRVMSKPRSLIVRKGRNSSVHPLSRS